MGNVTILLNQTGAKTIEVTGHSLGAAIAVMDAVMIKQNVPSDVDVVTRVFGLPRGGNQEWADFVDKTVRISFFKEIKILILGKLYLSRSRVLFIFTIR